MEIHNGEDEPWEMVKGKKMKKLTQKQLEDLRQLHAAMGHMHPEGMVKAIEAKAVVIPEHLTVEMIKKYGKLAEGCGPCLQRS